MILGLCLQSFRACHAFNSAQKSKYKRVSQTNYVLQAQLKITDITLTRRELRIEQIVESELDL